MPTLEPVNQDSRKIGSSVEIFDVFHGHSNPKLVGNGTIVGMTKTKILVSFNGDETMFHRSTGFVVDNETFKKTEHVWAIRPQTSK